MTFVNYNIERNHAQKFGLPILFSTTGTCIA